MSTSHGTSQNHSVQHLQMVVYHIKTAHAKKIILNNLSFKENSDFYYGKQTHNRFNFV